MRRQFRPVRGYSFLAQQKEQSFRRGIERKRAQANNQRGQPSADPIAQDRHRTGGAEEEEAARRPLQICKSLLFFSFPIWWSVRPFIARDWRGGSDSATALRWPLATSTEKARCSIIIGARCERAKNQETTGRVRKRLIHLI